LWHERLLPFERTKSIQYQYCDYLIDMNVTNGETRLSRRQFLVTRYRHGSGENQLSVAKNFDVAPPKEKEFLKPALVLSQTHGTVTALTSLLSLRYLLLDNLE
jgi:hypothetical protein